MEVLKAIGKTVENIINNYNLNPAVNIEFGGDIDIILNCKSIYNNYESCCASEIQEIKYFIVDKDGNYKEIPYGEYNIKHGSKYIDDIEEIKDIKIKDYVNDNTVAVIEYYRFDSTYTSPSGEEYLKIYFKDNIDLKKELIKLVDKCNDNFALLRAYSKF